MPPIPPPKHHSYSEIPTVANWVADSPLDTLSSAKRSDDAAVAIVDELVGALEKAATHGQRCYRLAELFFATMWWMNHRRLQPGFKPGSDARRQAAMLRLNLCAANKLALMLWCPIGELARELQDIYGIGMTQHGTTTDGPGGVQGGYLKDDEREKYRVIFRKGRAYRFKDATVPRNADKPIGDAELNPASTRGFVDASGREGFLFVMTMSGELFVRPETAKGIYHSSLVGGKPVLCAGTICIDAQGMITRICNNSGHYGPADTAMAKVLQRLRLAGVNLSSITVVDQDPKKGKTLKAKTEGEDDQFILRSVRGDLFLACNGNWATIEKSGTRWRQLTGKAA